MRLSPRFAHQSYSTTSGRSRRLNFQQLLGHPHYNRRNEFGKTIESLEERVKVEPNNPEALFTISTYYWDRAQRNLVLTESDKRATISRGLDAVERALALNPDYFEALIYKGRLLMLQADIEPDAQKRAALTAEVRQLNERAENIKKMRVVSR